MSDNFLTRWSRLKTEKSVPVEVPQTADELKAIIDALPEIENIKAGDMLSAFMQKGVPDILRNAALRKIWAADSVLTEQLCQPLDYWYDYNNPVGVVGFEVLPEGFDVSEAVGKLLDTMIEANEGEGVERALAPPDLVMEVSTSASSSAADIADDLPCNDPVALTNIKT